MRCGVVSAPLFLLCYSISGINSFYLRTVFTLRLNSRFYEACFAQLPINVINFRGLRLDSASKCKPVGHFLRCGIYGELEFLL